MQGPDTDAQDQPPPFTHIRLATHGRSIQSGQKLKAARLNGISVPLQEPTFDARLA